MATSVVGVWSLTIKVPLGTQTSELQITKDGHGTFEGFLEGPYGMLSLKKCSLDTEDCLIWEVEITSPTRVTLQFIMHLVDGQLEGHVKIGPFQRVSVSGYRVT